MKPIGRKPSTVFWPKELSKLINANQHTYISTTGKQRTSSIRVNFGVTLHSLINQSDKINQCLQTKQGRIQGLSSYANGEVIFPSSEIKNRLKECLRWALKYYQIKFFFLVIQRLKHVSFIKTTNEIIFHSGILRGKKFSIFINTLF